MTTPRKHHFTPCFYLAGFTPSGSSEDRLHVLDKTDGRQWRSRPADAGCQRDFYMLEVEDEGDPAALEDLFGKIETQGAEAIRALIEAESVPQGALREKLTTFLGIMAVRVPGVLEAIDEFTAKVVKSMGLHMTASKQVWKSTVERLRADGKDISDTPWEQMRDFARSDDYDIAMSQNFRMGTLVQLLAPAASLTAARKWTVLRAPRGGPGFICSDRPLTITWKPEHGVGGLPPALGMPNTIVWFPVNKRLALSGVFEEPRPTCDLDAFDVGVFNLCTALFARRFVYSTGPDFVVTLKSGTTGGQADFMRAITSDVKENEPES